MTGGPSTDQVAFRIVDRGYDPEQVMEHLRSLGDGGASDRGGLDRWASTGEAAASVLRTAEAEAAALVEAAEAVAASVRRELQGEALRSREEADAIVRAAQERAAAIVAEAEAQAGAIRAELDAARTQADARHRADQEALRRTLDQVRKVLDDALAAVEDPRPSIGAEGDADPGPAPM
ncbi:MAG: hypothetical protein U0P45_11505 [Acidimicrobiales bacterium]